MNLKRNMKKHKLQKMLKNKLINQGKFNTYYLLVDGVLGLLSYNAYTKYTNQTLSKKGVKNNRIYRKIEWILA